MDTNTDESFEALLRYMRDSRGFDFTGYKRTTLMRRVRHRMTHAGYETYEEYLDVRQASSDEFWALFNTILINVTAFFRFDRVLSLFPVSANRATSEITPIAVNTT